MELADVNFPLFVGNAKFRPFFSFPLKFSKVYVCVSATSKHNDFMVMDWMIPLFFCETFQAAHVQ